MTAERSRRGRSIDEVVVHLADHFVVAGVDEALREAGRAAEVDAEDGVSAVGEPLVVLVEAPVVAGPGSAVDDEDELRLVAVAS